MLEIYAFAMRLPGCNPFRMTFKAKDRDAALPHICRIFERDVTGHPDATLAAHTEDYACALATFEGQ